MENRRKIEEVNHLVYEGSVVALRVFIREGAGLVPFDIRKERIWEAGLHNVHIGTRLVVADKSNNSTGIKDISEDKETLYKILTCLLEDGYRGQMNTSDNIHDYSLKDFLEDKRFKVIKAKMFSLKKSEYGLRLPNGKKWEGVVTGACDEQTAKRLFHKKAIELAFQTNKKLSKQAIESYPELMKNFG